MSIDQPRRPSGAPASAGGQFAPTSRPEGEPGLPAGTGEPTQGFQEAFAVPDPMRCPWCGSRMTVEHDDVGSGYTSYQQASALECDSPGCGVWFPVRDGEDPASAVPGWMRWPSLYADKEPANRPRHVTLRPDTVTELAEAVSGRTGGSPQEMAVVLEALIDLSDRETTRVWNLDG